MNWSEFHFRVAGFSEIDSIVALWEQDNKNTEKHQKNCENLLIGISEIKT